MAAPAGMVQSQPMQQQEVIDADIQVAGDVAHCGDNIVMRKRRLIGSSLWLLDIGSVGIATHIGPFA